jgi:hypothetical protein
MPKKRQLILLNHLTDKWGLIFAQGWLNAWNSHDIDEVLDCYADNFIMVSPVVNGITGDGLGLFYAKKDFKVLCLKIFEEIPELKFELIATEIGVRSLSIYYTSQKFKLTIDVFEIEARWKIFKSSITY